MKADDMLAQGLEQLGLDVDQLIQSRLLDYLRLMQKWNRAYNLTAITDLQQMVVRHLLDSLAVNSWIDKTPVLDVGSGAGLPGIPLALVRPDIQFALLDSNGKKCRFQTQVKIELGIENIEVFHQRVEDHQPADKPAIIICRAFSGLNQLLEKVQHLVTSETRVLAMKARSEDPAGIDVFKLIGDHRVDVPFLDEQRRLLIYVPLCLES